MSLDAFFRWQFTLSPSFLFENWAISIRPTMRTTVPSPSFSSEERSVGKCSRSYFRPLASTFSCRLTRSATVISFGELVAQRLFLRRFCSWCSGEVVGLSPTIPQFLSMLRRASMSANGTVQEEGRTNGWPACPRADIGESPAKATRSEAPTAALVLSIADSSFGVTWVLYLDHPFTLPRIRASRSSKICHVYLSRPTALPLTGCVSSPVQGLGLGGRSLTLRYSSGCG